MLLQKPVVLLLHRCILLQVIHIPYKTLFIAANMRTVQRFIDHTPINNTRPRVPPHPLKTPGTQTQQ